MPQVAKLVRLQVVDGQRDQLVAALDPVRELAAGDAGTEVWTIHARGGNPNEVFIYELYRDESPVLKTALQATHVFMAAPPEIIHGEVLASSAV
jgi:quinol monooxygenase YgiN